MDENTRWHNSKWLIPLNQSSDLTKDRFARIISSYVNLSALDVNNICGMQLWVGSDIPF